MRNPKVVFSIDSTTANASESEKTHNSSYWSIEDSTPARISGAKLPLESFNHIAKEVLSLEKSRHFYVEILGFTQIPRPPFDCEGFWLYGYGLSLHLVETTTPEDRKEVKMRRIMHFSTALPRVDHIAFITSSISFVKKVLDDAKVFYKEDCPKDTGIRQIFLFDPDGNVIEISNCSPEVGATSCAFEVNDSESGPHVVMVKENSFNPSGSYSQDSTETSSNNCMSDDNLSDDNTSLDGSMTTLSLDSSLNTHYSQ
jgi:catechol 2,3-dioxygenase-like lactoylglutathione lyase family enzyme